MKAHIVVGMGYGDEGKGITTDYLCTQLPSPIVVRFSGGSQAGHTVRANDKIHTHSNFGAGTLRGYPSYFSEHTCIYPVHINREKAVLESKGANPELIIHPLAKVITPFDILANKLDKQNLLHGTCGKGIGKTMKRNEGPCKLVAIDLMNLPILIDKLSAIGAWYNMTPDSSIGREVNEELSHFVNAVQDLNFTIAGYDYLKQYHSVIFEGSQGVLLDMDHGCFPNVTYSNTTSKNAIEICDKLGIKDRGVYHVTRAYHTRHGNGEFNESILMLQNTEDENNVNNVFQGKFKKRPLNYDLLNHAIAVDSIYSDSTCDKTLVVTCNDQIVNIADSFDLGKVDRKYFRIIKSYSSDSKKMKREDNLVYHK